MNENELGKDYLMNMNINLSSLRYIYYIYFIIQRFSLNPTRLKS